MPSRLPRRKIAQHAADRLLAGDADVIKQVAALLVQEGRQREAELVVRDITDALAERGTVVATVTSAHELSDQIKASIKSLVGADKVVLQEQVDRSVIGGIKIDAAGRRYDGTVKYKLSELRAQKI